MRDPNCTACPLSADTDAAKVCVPMRVESEAGVDVLVLSKFPLSERGRAEFREYMREAGCEDLRLAFTAVLRCNPWGATPSKSDIKTCSSLYLGSDLASAGSGTVVLALGAEALQVTTGLRKITDNRGQVNDSVFATIAPGAIKHNPGQRDGFIADLRMLGRVVRGEGPRLEDPAIAIVDDLVGFKILLGQLERARAISYDIETNGFDEFRDSSEIVSIAFTIENWNGDLSVWAVPLAHPRSPFKKSWRFAIEKLTSAMAAKEPRRAWGEKSIIAHNGKFDGRWLRQFGSTRVIQTFDTMLAAALLNENRPKGLKPLAQSLLGVHNWAISTKSLQDEDLEIVLRYNALDTWYTHHLYWKFRDQLEEKGLATLFYKMIMPASDAFIDIEQRGIWVDRPLMLERAVEADRTLAEIDDRLMAHVPEGAEGINFNASNFARWWLFDHLDLPVLARGKEKPDGSPGWPSMAESVLQKIQADKSVSEEGRAVVSGLLERVKWRKYATSFFAPYQELIDDQDRIHTTFKLAGTVTGRLSSGKGDSEKVTGRVQNRGVNLQQVPRDSFVRGIFGAPPGSVFVECDYSQIELRVAAFLAREATMLHLYRTGQDIHTTMARTMTGRQDVTKDERKKAKAVNFGFLYGMGARKFIETAWSNYGVVVTEAEAEAFRRAFFDLYPELPRWHARQRRLAREYKRVVSPIGRIRHLPDIDSDDRGVRAEAERQAINSPVQSFASDMTLMSLVILTRLFREKGLKAHSVGTVHDAINFEVPESELHIVVPLIRKVMENLPLERTFGVVMNLPIIADVAVGKHWGGAEEIPGEISQSPAAMIKWMEGKQ